MDWKRNPSKNAESAMEQNHNQIDGIINNLPALLSRKKRWTGFVNTRPSAATRSVRSVDKKAAALCPSSRDGDSGGADVDHWPHGRCQDLHPIWGR